MKRLLTLSFLPAIILVSCQNKSHDIWLQDGIWRGEIVQNDSTSTPFLFHLDPDSLQLTIQNADERIQVTRIQRKGDTLMADLPVFNSRLMMIRVNADSMVGTFFHEDGGYQLPFRATQGSNERFRSVESPMKLESRYLVTFYPGEERERKAIGEFQQDKGHITGTILNTSGNYRFLDGTVTEDRLQLSTFDGRTVYYFDARGSADSLFGWWFSGNAEPRRWVAVPNKEFELPDADSLIFLNPGYEGISFSFPTPEGKMVESNPESQTGKVTILTVMGSWCPNCMDEARFLTELYDKYADHGLQIYGLSFENAQDFEGAAKAVTKMKEDLGIPYTILIAGRPGRENTLSALPMLSSPPSFPTAIYIGKNGEVRRIHKGFNGPGSSEYPEYVKETETFIKELLKE
ncbi:MAG: TlpA family protein disulfide reductase [Bacteroidota bacterium]|nr:TlpA family protein disulfide reductase [Bacteroidota bacterium]